jgi:hypothetical protein
MIYKVDLKNFICNYTPFITNMHSFFNDSWKFKRTECFSQHTINVHFSLYHMKVLKKNCMKF